VQEAKPGAGVERHCAYNHTKGRFLGADVDVADLAVADLDDRMPTLTPRSGAGLWLVPFRGISATSVRVPVDLVYLDRNYIVIDTVASFPISTASASSSAAASVLVLPARTIASTQTQKGDQLIVCDPETMKAFLEQADVPTVEAGAVQAAGPVESASAGVEEPTRVGAGRVLQWQDRSRATAVGQEAIVEEPAVEQRPVEVQPPIQQSPEPAPAVAPQTKTAKPAKNWLQRLLSPDPVLPRKAERESLPGLTAYFFTGGAPVAHEIRDISLSGLYVVTEERWYPGTTVMMTLTDRSDTTHERSISLYATAVRWGADGVGVRFILQDAKKQRQGNVSTAEGVGVKQLEQFLQSLRNSNS
jgi:hypothetical protein